MVRDLQIVEEPGRPVSMEPKKFALWLFIVTIVMLFAAFTSAYIVRQAEGNWLDFSLPSIFYWNTGILLLSSVTMQWAYNSAKRDDLKNVKTAIFLSIVLGIGFLVGQIFGWDMLVDDGVFFVGNPSGSFMYIFTGLHGVHLISGIIFIIIVLIATIKYKVHSKNILLIEMCNTYWHFLDALWVYLFVFLLLNR
ncbi:MAG: cytochrome c oxidase subunit 3 [Bacteroidetes bacterium]|nr:cytochrome c oxidase subunit 3 [Bacteroidota bacterium]MCH8232337.1 cytochrome c oxidase subunit 3 [Bacteroidota bacterium]